MSDEPEYKEFWVAESMRCEERFAYLVVIAVHWWHPLLTPNPYERKRLTGVRLLVEDPMSLMFPIHMRGEWSRVVRAYEDVRQNINHRRLWLNIWQAIIVWGKQYQQQKRGRYTYKIEAPV